MKKMNAKRTLVSFLTIATLLFLVATVSAYTVNGDLANVYNIEINGIEVDSDNISVIAGETISVKVFFTSMKDTSNVRIKAELEGDKEDVDAITTPFDVENGKKYAKTLTLRVPYELTDDVSDDVTLSLKIWNGDYKTEIDDITLRVQRPSYNADIMSIIVSSSLEAGQISPVDIVLKNIGYNDLEDLYVTVRIPELSISRTAYFGDLVAEETSDDEDTVSGRIYLEVPYDVASGIYTLEVEVANEDFSNIVEEQVAVKNGFPEVAVKSGDNLLVLNPTNHLKIYKVVYPSTELTVVVQAGSSKLVPIEVSEGEYNFDVFVFAGNELAGTVKFSGTSESEELASPVVVLTVILAIIFLVLLVVMIVLITKKPEKTEEFGESYY
ncbi:hypothetical protein KAT24_00195 [Candidatus Pacearchaeota archaeon]|nr:hypothetical protein [Candidatus Pacearchaeota archaeon]